MTVPVADLLAHYRTDAAHADALYKGKRIRVIGPREIRADAAGGPMVTLADRATGTTQSFHYGTEKQPDAGGPLSPPLVAEAIFYKDDASLVSNLTTDKPVVANCTVEGLSTNVRLVGCSFADLTVYDACRQMLRFNCLLPGWREDARVPFLFTGVTWWRTDAIERKVAEAWTDDGRAPLAMTDLDPEHHLSALERRYADRVIGMVVRADSRPSYERDIAAMNARGDAGGFGRRYAADPASRTYVIFPPNGDSEHEHDHERENRESTEAHAKDVLYRLPQVTD